MSFAIPKVILEWLFLRPKMQRPEPVKGEGIPHHVFEGSDMIALLGACIKGVVINHAVAVIPNEHEVMCAKAPYRHVSDSHAPRRIEQPIGRH